MLSSRLGLTKGALEVGDDLDFWDLVVEQRTNGRRIDYLICDEAQFYRPAQIEQLARLVDEMGIDVYAFGITAVSYTHLTLPTKRMLPTKRIV